MIPPDLSAVVERARCAGEPSTDDEIRIRTLLVARIGAEAFDAPPPSFGPSAGGIRPGTGTRWGTKALVGLSIMMGAGALLHALPAAPPVVEEAAPVGHVAQTEARKPVVSANALPIWVSDRPRPTAPPEPQEAPAPKATAVAANDDGGNTVAEELRILMRARATLSAGDPAGALAVLDEHVRRFPRGVLAEERSSQRVIALARAGRADEARSEGERFLKEHPASPFTSRVRDALSITNP